jgi:hypothetical protein
MNHFTNLGIQQVNRFQFQEMDQLSWLVIYIVMEEKQILVCVVEILTNLRVMMMWLR